MYSRNTKHDKIYRMEMQILNINTFIQPGSDICINTNLYPYMMQSLCVTDLLSMVIGERHQF